MATAVTCRVAYLLELSTNYEREQKDHDYSDNGKCFGRVEGNSTCGWQGLRRLWHEGTCNLPEGAGGPKQFGQLFSEPLLTSRSRQRVLLSVECQPLQSPEYASHAWQG